MAIYASIDRLNRMHQLFTQEGNKKLDRGEVDALAAFHSGLSSSSKAKIHDRMIEIFQTSKYSKSQENRFRNMLQDGGFSLSELAGVDENTIQGFLALDPESQFEKLAEIDNEWADLGVSKSIEWSDIGASARSKIEAQLDEIEESIKENHGEETWVETPGSIKALYLEAGSDGAGKKLAGFSFEIPIYTGDHDVDEAHFFTVKGDHVGDEYRGE